MTFPPPPFEEQAQYLKFADQFLARIYGRGPPLGKASLPPARKPPNETQSENATSIANRLTLNAAKKRELAGLFGGMY